MMGSPEMVNTPLSSTDFLYFYRPVLGQMLYRKINILKILPFCLILCLMNQKAFLQEIPDSLLYEPKKVKITGHPILGFTPETNWAFGAAAIVYFRTESYPLSNPSMVNPFLFYTLNKQFMVVTKGDIYRKKSITVFRLKAGRMPDYFFGIGSFTDKNSERYLRKTFGSELKYIYKATPDIFTGIQIEAHRNLLSNFAENSKLLEENIAGIEDGTIFGIGPSIRIEKRDNIIYPHKGWYLATDLLYYPGGLPGKYQFNSFLFDFRYFISSVNYKNTLGMQFINEFKQGSSIPFYELSALGGETRARGINANRYIDKNALFTQIEYRRKLPLNFGVVAFAGAGQVYPELSAFQLSNLKYNVGFGIRMLALPEEQANFRLDIGFGPKGERHWYVGIQEVF